MRKDESQPPKGYVPALCFVIPPPDERAVLDGVGILSFRGCSGRGQPPRGKGIHWMELTVTLVVKDDTRCQMDAFIALGAARHIPLPWSRMKYILTQDYNLVPKSR
jgi:hypothetical protein